MRESLRRPWREGNCAKYFSDHLVPLRRLLRSKVGQHWDDIYSELCQRLDRKTVIGQHVFHHIWDIVERDIIMVDGVPYRKVRRKDTEPTPFSHWRGGLYIHPETGILCLAQNKSQPVPEKRDCIVIDTNHCYQQIDQLWYFVTLREIPEGEIVWDVVLKNYIKRSSWMGAIPQYAASKRQCNKKELKRIEQQLTPH
uniref:Uncharacterized protein n=1 Tax=Desertifilum tharense IPPAS B-1220 TaxID=1781255 RepID=A0ACD5GVA2_9CYAN